MPKYSCTGRNKPIRIYKSMRYRIIVSALEVVEACIRVIVIASISQRLNVGKIGRAGYLYVVCVSYRNRITPNIIGILRIKIAFMVIQSDNIATALNSTGEFAKSGQLRGCPLRFS